MVGREREGEREREERGKGARVNALYNVTLALCLFIVLHNSGAIVWIIRAIKRQVI